MKVVTQGSVSGQVDGSGWTGDETLAGSHTGVPRSSTQDGPSLHPELLIPPLCIGSEVVVTDTVCPESYGNKPLQKNRSQVSGGQIRHPGSRVRPKHSQSRFVPTPNLY